LKLLIAGVKFASLAPLALIFWLISMPCRGQDIEPRRWSHLPSAINFAGGAFVYTTGEIFLDPTLRIEDAEFDLRTAAGKYIRSFELLGKSARVDFTQPYQRGTWTGLLNGERATVKRDGWGDTTVRLAVNLVGAPPLKGREFAEYRARTKRETIVGAGLIVQLPTGQYFKDKLINLSSNRITFRPQIGIVHNHGKWSEEITAAFWFFTDNDAFFNGSRLKQEPSIGLDAHLIYTFRPGLWVSASLGYLGWGETSVNGVSSNNSQTSFGWGMSAGIPISRSVGVKIAYIGTRTGVGTGLDADNLTCAFSVMW